MTYPMRDILVVDLTQIYNGPYATYQMALAGADVIKVEPPGGEPLRKRSAVGGAALPFAMLNGCKKSVVLDLKTEQGKAALMALSAKADVLVENFAPGVMDRLGLGADVLMAANPRLIYASSSGYGRDGPYAAWPAMDLTVQAISGIMQVTGFPDRPPVKAGPAVADFFAGIHLYGAIATALMERERFGVARRVDVAMQDAVYATLSSNLGMFWSDPHSPIPARTGNRHGGMAECPYNVYPTRDGYIAIICVGDQHWKALLGVMNRKDLADDPALATLAERVKRMDEIDALVGEWTVTQDTDPLFASLMAAKVPSAPVRDLDAVMDDPNMHARGALQRIDHPELGSIVVPHSPMCYEGVPRRPLTASAPLGKDTADILAQFKGEAA
jgi:formyl-CoA transferase